LQLLLGLFLLRRMLSGMWQLPLEQLFEMSLHLPRLLLPLGQFFNLQPKLQLGGCLKPWDPHDFSWKLVEKKKPFILEQLG